MRELYAGVDVGSTAVRIGLLDAQGELKYVEFSKIRYHVDERDDTFVTQSSRDIAAGMDICLARLQGRLETDEMIVSIACAATCSLAAFKKNGDDLVPVSVKREFDDNDQNVVFWMDSRARKQAQEINSILKDNKLLDYYGGSFIPEMAIPEVKYLIDNMPSLEDIVFMDLHNYLTYRLLHKDGEYSDSITVSNSDTQRSIDGELQGWNADFLRTIGLGTLTVNNFQALYTAKKQTEDIGFHELPLAGSRIGTTRNNIVVSQGIIDSYAGWIGASSSNIENTLTMVAGTSTCFIIGHGSKEVTIRGVWGPYEGIISGLYVSEAGQSTTGKLIEHLFETHPAFPALSKYNNAFDGLEIEIAKLENDQGENIHFITKYIYNYGELSGNRTPYGDSSMRGVFFGESVDTSVNDLVIKYISILEFLAFQTKQIVQLFKDSSVNIAKIVICGSQALNKRLVQLIADVTNLPVAINKISPDLSGVRGAAYLGVAGLKGKPLTEVISNFSREGAVLLPDRRDIAKEKLLSKKYDIVIDVAERQRTYKSWIDDELI